MLTAKSAINKAKPIAGHGRIGPGMTIPTCCAKAFSLFGTGNLKAHTAVETALVHAISEVILRCPDKEMIRIDTAWDIASVTDHEALRNWPTMQLPRDAMSTLQLAASFDLPITRRARCPYPEPASTLRHWDILPGKPCHEIHDHPPGI